MQPHSLIIGNHPQNVTVAVNEIGAYGDVEGPHLFIPISISLKPYRRGSAYPYTEFSLHHLSVELYVTDKEFKASQISMPIQCLIHEPYTHHMNLSFPLTRDTLFYIDKHRKGNLPAYLRITLQVAHFQDPPAARAGTNAPILSVRGFEVAQGQVPFHIEQSRWVNTILPKTGYTTSTLIELPTAAIILPEEYNVSIAELQEARKYFTSGDYDKTAGHCRSAIEPFKKNFSQIRAFITSKSEGQWIKESAEATCTYIDTVLGATYSVTNKVHHPPSMDHFGRSEAEVILNMTILILNYIGKITPAQELG